MVLIRFIVLIFGVLFCFIPTVQAESEVAISLPPQSIAQWYKPQNKRQVWLHTMFRLSRASQAIGEYVSLKDHKLLNKWVQQFAKDYRAIGTMVPEWKADLELEQLAKFESLVAKQQWGKVLPAMKKIKVSCKGCHDEYRIAAVGLYRSPAFDQVVNFEDHKDKLMGNMNGFKIAVADQRTAAAHSYLTAFAKDLDDFTESCKSCHEKEPVAIQRILGEQNAGLLKELKPLVDRAEADPVAKKLIGRKLGKIGVAVCAKCHAVHRTLYWFTKSLQY